MNKKKKILIIAIAVIAVIVVSVLSIIYLPLIWPRGTSLTISPSTFTLSSGESMAFVATLKSDGLTLTGSSITWTASIGSFDSTTGSAVTYRAPEVTESTAVTITASFPGEGPYMSSKATINGTIVPKEAEATALAISPSTFEVTSGGNITLSAVLTPSGAPSELITWELEGPGTLTLTTGASTKYVAPEVEEETTVKIIAEFPGTKDYLGSTAESFGTVMPPGVIVKKATTLAVTPSSFTVGPEGKVTLTATLKDIDGNVLTGKTINWVLHGPGTLSSATGATVTYTAPETVSEETTVKINATFLGDDEYLRSSIQVVGTVTPAPSIAEYAYAMKFEKLTVENAILEGPIKMLGVNVVKFTGELATATKLTLSPLGLNSSSASFQNMQIYATYLKAYSPELGKELEVLGDQTVSMSRDTLTLENGNITLIYLTSTNVELTNPELKGKYVGGTEPYIPVIVTAHSVTLKEGYLIEGPKTYEELVNKVNKLTAGKIEAADFTFTYPLEYALNRETNEYSYEPKWTMSASKLTGANALLYLIYFEATYGGITVKGTGEDSASTIIPHGFNAGWESPPLPDAKTHAVYFDADQLTLENVVIQIAT